MRWGQRKDGFKERRWVLLKIPRCDIDGVGEGGEGWVNGRKGGFYVFITPIFFSERKGFY